MGKTAARNRRADGLRVFPVGTTKENQLLNANLHLHVLFSYQQKIRSPALRRCSASSGGRGRMATGPRQPECQHFSYPLPPPAFRDGQSIQIRLTISALALVTITLRKAPRYSSPGRHAGGTSGLRLVPHPANRWRGLRW